MSEDRVTGEDLRSEGAPADERSYWLDDPDNIRLMYRGLWVVCIALLLLDLFYEKHAEFPAEGVLGFNALFGFVGFAVLVFSGKALRRFVQRPEDYYDR